MSHFGTLRLEIEYELTIIKTRAVILRETAHLHCDAAYTCYILRSLEHLTEIKMHRMYKRAQQQQQQQQQERESKNIESRTCYFCVSLLCCDALLSVALILPQKL